MLLRFHTPQHLKAMSKAFSDSELKNKAVSLDGDTTIVPGTRLAAYRAAGSACRKS